MPPLMVNGVQAKPLDNPRSGIFAGVWASAAPLMQAASATPVSGPKMDFDMKDENIWFPIRRLGMHLLRSRARRGSAFRDAGPLTPSPRRGEGGMRGLRQC